MPVGRIVKSGGFEAVKECYKNLGKKFEKALNDLIVFDAIICNVDRHFGNFGFIVDNETNQIVAPAPLFDHGNSLFNMAGRDDLESEEKLNAYAETLLPCVYDDFIETAKQVLIPEHREGLRKLLDFKFRKHPRYNLPDKRLRLIEKQIHNRAKILLDK